MALVEKYKLSTYKEVSVITENSSKKICIVMDETTNKLYVQKILSGTEQFQFYMRIAALQHKNLVKIHDVVCCDGSTHIIEEYINGQTLQALLETEGIQQENKVTYYVMQVCDALMYLHSQTPPIIYRDIKPENIMLTADHVIKLIDFDIAREFKQSANRDTTFMGTKEYAAPEQYGYKQTDGRTDIYAIGVLIHELATGKLPQSTIHYKGALKKVIKKCLQLEPKYRYQSVFALKKALSGTRFHIFKKIGIYISSAVLLVVVLIVSLLTTMKQMNRAVSFFSQVVMEQDANDLEDSNNSNVPDVLNESDIPEDSKEPDVPVKSDTSNKSDASDNLNTSNEIDTITITSENADFTAQIPSDWKEDFSLNEAADLQASKERTSSYFVLLTDAKNDLDFSFKDFRKYVFDTLADMEDLEVSEEVQLTINGLPAIQQTLSGINEGTRVKLLLTYIDGNTYFAQILCASTYSNYEDSLSSFELITHSITGL